MTVTNADSPSLYEEVIGRIRDKMTVNEAKKKLMAWPGVVIEGKLKAKTVDFTDLARCSKSFIEIGFAKRPNSEVVREMKTFCKENGFILSNNQVWRVI